MVKTTGPPTLVRRPRFDHMESTRLASCLFTMDWRIKIFEAHLFLVHVLTPKPNFCILNGMQQCNSLLKLFCIFTNPVSIHRQLVRRLIEIKWCRIDWSSKLKAEIVIFDFASIFI